MGAKLRQLALRRGVANRQAVVAVDLPVELGELLLVAGKVRRRAARFPEINLTAGTSANRGEPRLDGGQLGSVGNETRIIRRLQPLEFFIREGEKEPVLQDWPRIPLPKDLATLERSAALGREITALLEPWTTVPGVTSGKMRSELRLLGRAARIDAGQIDPDAGDLDVTAGWGHPGKGGTITMPGKGRSVPRAFSANELAAVDQGPGPQDWRVEGVAMANQEMNLRKAGGRDHGRAFVERDGHRLFDQHMLAGLRGERCVLGMKLMGRCDINHIDARISA